MMDKIIIDSFGKINLILDILYKREDGYHELNTIMQEIALKDVIEIESQDHGISIEANNNDLPLDEENLVHKAWRILSQEFKIDKGVSIKIKKNIPIAAGLAGGSSNAAAVLKGLNKLWNLNLSLEELQTIGLKIGADVPFCLLGGTAYGEGIGQILTPIRKLKDKEILIANIGVPISTAYVYENLKLKGKTRSFEIDKMIKYIEEDDIENVSKYLANTMEDVVIKEYPIIGEIKKTMIENGALGALMSGSGPTVFGIFNDNNKIHKCKAILEERIENVIITKTI